ncbi:hypothetical protein C9I50_01775 [Pseudomonas prosekii]|nr:hypothetical protein C9I50_01775 [Pseudomonas prosekii]
MPGTDPLWELSLLAIAVGQSMQMLAVTAPSRASFAPTDLRWMWILCPALIPCRSRACSRKRWVSRRRCWPLRRLREQALLLRICGGCGCCARH